MIQDNQSEAGYVRHAKILLALSVGTKGASGCCAHKAGNSSLPHTHWSRFVLLASLAVAMLGVANLADAALIGTPSFVASSSPTDLSAMGSADWRLYGADLGPTQTPSEQHARGASITMLAPVITSPCISDNTHISRASATFSWTNGLPQPVGSAVDPYDNGLIFANATNIDYYVNYETLTFLPGDTNLHTIHLYGYLNNNNSGITFQFSNSLAGASSVIQSFSPSVGAWDYSVTFQANNPTDLFRVVFTFQKTGTTTTAKRMGIQAAAMDGVPLKPGLEWRVINDDPAYPSEDLIVALCAVTDPYFQLPSDPANTDCTAAFQAALDFASEAGGGIVFVPAGQYRLGGTLQIASGVTLRGRWRDINASQPAGGTILKVYSGRGNASGTAFISGVGGSGVRDLTFWYPLQDPTNIVPYPFAIAGPQTVENITFVNAYQGINFANASMCHVSNIKGTVLHYGFYADQSAAISRFEKIDFGPEYWEWADLPNATPVNTAYRTFMLTNGTGIDIRDMDGFHLWDCRVRGMKTGLLFALSPINNAGPSGGYVSGLDIRDCVVAFDYAAGGPTLVNSYLQGTDTAIKKVNGLTCTGCTIKGGNAAVSGNSGINALLTTFDGMVNITNGSVKLVGCNFTNTGTDVVLGSSVDFVQIVGCSFADGPGIIDNSPGSITKIINHNPISGYSAPPVLPSKDLSIVRKPYKTNLFDITHYGAAPGDSRDDSAAFAAAVAAANANGGGIVFVPNGIFEVAGSYTLAPGVELRGTRGSLRGATSAQPGSLLQISGNEGNSNGPAFPNLNANCGVRGMAFHYNNQRADMLYPETIIPYPFTIRATGSNTYISETFMSDPYQGIHFYRADNHLLEDCNFGGLNNTILIEECQNGRIGKFHLKPDFWRDTDIGNHPVGGGDDVDWYSGRHLTSIWLKNSTNEMVYSIFNHDAHNFMRVDNSSGLGDKVGGEVLQGGYRFSGGKDFSLIFPNPLHNQWGDGSGMFSFWLETNFTGTVSVWHGGIAGTPGKAFCVQSGTFDGTQFSFPSWSQRGNEGIQVDSGGVLNLKMTGLGLNSGNLVTSLAPGARFSWLDSSSAIPNALLRHPGVSLARDVYSSAYISTWTGSGQIVNDGMILAPSNLSIEDSEISSFYKKIQGARTTDGDYSVKVVDPDFTNGTPSVSINTYWRIDTDCTIKIYYNSISGTNKLGNTAVFTNGAAAPDYQSVNFSVSDARFTGSNDIVITITGASPLLNYVNVFRNVTSVPIFPPAITVQPASRTNNAATPATFTVLATGTSPGFRWMKNGVPLANGGNVSGATAATLSLGAVSQSDAASYTVVITNKGGTVTSSAATLTVIASPPPPVASFTATPARGIRPLPVTFTDTSTGNITNLLWSFGDNQTTNTVAGAMVSHTYQTEGTYTVSLIASGPGGSGTNTQTGCVTVLIPNPPQIGGITSFGANALVMQGSGGPSNGGYSYWLRSSTNLALPLTNWSIVATNPFDAYGSFSNQIPVTPGTPQVFYRLELP